MEIFHQALSLPLLQNPFNQAKTLTGLGAVSLALGKHEEGLQFAEHAQKLCAGYGLRVEMRMLYMLLAQHQLSLPVRQPDEHTPCYTENYP